jgi:hypothetical protein
MTKSLHEYEAMLDALDNKLFIKNRAIVIDFGPGLFVQLSDCQSTEGIVKCALEVRKTIKEHLFCLPEAYLMKRFLRLVMKFNGPDFDIEDVLQRIEAAIKSQSEVWTPK